MKTKQKFLVSGLFTFASIFSLSVCSISCGSSDDEVLKSDEKVITTFAVEDYDVDIDHNAKTIVIHVPKSANIKGLRPDITLSERAEVEPASGVQQDFTEPVDYVVTAENQTTVTYRVSAERIYGLTNFKLNIGSDVFEGEVDHQQKEIVVSMNIEYARRLLKIYALTVSGETLPGYSFAAEGSTIDLDNPVDQLVYDEATQEYDAYALIIKNTNNALSGIVFTLGNARNEFGTITGNAYPEDTQGLADDGFVISVLPTDNISSLVPALELPVRATVTPAPTTARNFNSDVTYTVTSETGDARTFTIRVVKRSVIIVNDHDPRNSNGISANQTIVQLTYKAVSTITLTKLIGATETIDCTFSLNDYVINGETLHYLTFSPSKTLPAGKYTLYVELANGEKITTRGKFTKY